MPMEMHGAIILAIAVLGLIAVVVISASLRDREDGQSLYPQSLYGKWRVRYPDGSLSQLLHRDTAEAYARIHGGVLEEEKEGGDSGATIEARTPSRRAISGPGNTP